MPRFIILQPEIILTPATVPFLRIRTLKNKKRPTLEEKRKSIVIIIVVTAGDVEQYSDEEYGRRGRAGGGERAGPGARGRRGFSR